MVQVDYTFIIDTITAIGVASVAVVVPIFLLRLFWEFLADLLYRSR